MTINDKRYWKNVAGYYMVVIASVVLIGLGLSYDEPDSFDPLGGFVVVSLGAIAILGHKIGLEFSKDYTPEEEKLLRKLRDLEDRR